MTIPFLLVSLVLIVSAVVVVAASNPIHSALALIVHLVGVACVFADLNAHFLAVVQVIVYAGAIMVLVLFVLMLLNSKEERGRRQVLPALAFGLVAGVSFLWLFVYSMKEGGSIFAGSFWARPEIPLESAQIPITEGSVQAIGHLLYTEYLLPFEAASLLIMAAVVGATMIAKVQKREISSGGSKQVNLVNESGR